MDGKDLPTDHYRGNLFSPVASCADTSCIYSHDIPFKSLKIIIAVMPSATARIAKNTFALYFRQILIMLVSLYTVRVVLNTLGADDYGIYNVAGGLVVLFSFLNGAMTSGTQRFLNYALGQNNTEEARNVYSLSFIMYGVIALFVIILAETIGLWFLQTQLNIPAGRKGAAFAVYQCSIAAAVIGMLRAPYHATIIAYEKMSFFALVSVIESLLKLGTVFLLAAIRFDSLIVYAFLIFIVGIITFLFYKFYCNKTFEIACFRYSRDKKLLYRIASFSGWSVFGGIANVSNSQGANILINIFSGVGVNAAMGIATQVNTAVYQFVSNFQTAFNPQIVKLYAAKEYDYFMRLIFRTSKFSYLLLFFFVLPLYVNTEYILQIWLKNVPEYTVVFTRLILLFSLIDAISGPLWMSVQAAGNIKKYQLIVSCFIFANLPLSFMFLKFGFSPVWVLIIRVALNSLASGWRVFYLRIKIKLPAINFLSYVIVPIVIISGVSGGVLFLLHNRFSGFSNLIVSCAVSVIVVSGLIYLVGLKREEQELLKKIIKNKFGLIQKVTVL
jgi:O-antigen/teichoic acid export membrane protein